MPEIIDFPHTLIITDRTDPILVQANRSAGVAMDGGEQIASSLSQQWRWSILVPVFTKAHARALRVVKTRAKGRFNYLRIRLCDQYRITWRDIGGVAPHSVPHSDGAYFSDGSGYAYSSPITTAAADAAEGATQVTVAGSVFGGYMTAGVWFSVDGWLYHVDNWTQVGDNYRLDISPPVRAAITAGDEADFNAVALWTMRTDDEADIELRVGKLGNVRINLSEPIGRDL